MWENIDFGFKITLNSIFLEKEHYLGSPQRTFFIQFTYVEERLDTDVKYEMVCLAGLFNVQYYASL